MSQFEGGDAPAAEKTHCCPQADVEVTEQVGLIVFILNVISPGTGTLVAACLNKSGCNCQTALLAFGQSFLVPICCIGWYMAIVWGKRVHEESKGKV